MFQLWAVQAWFETEAHVESDEEVAEDDYHVAKASGKKERKKEEREAQRRVC